MMQVLTGLLCFVLVLGLASAADSAKSTSTLKTAPMDASRAALVLNEQFTSSSLTSGVVLRNTDELKMYCGQGCYKGHSDCTYSAAFYNRRISIDNESRFTSIYNDAVLAGLVLNSSVLEKYSRCYSLVDSDSWFRYNDGCGALAPCHGAHHNTCSCSNPHSPYYNVDPSGVFQDGDTPESRNVLCSRGISSPESCIWRGPAYNTSHGPYGANEFEQFMESRLKNIRYPWPLEKAWNEILLDVPGLRTALEKDPASVIAGIFVVQDIELMYCARGAFYCNLQTQKPAVFHSLAVKAAKKLQGDLEAAYGMRWPVVGISQSTVVSQSQGPFVEYKIDDVDWAASELASEIITV